MTDSRQLVDLAKGRDNNFDAIRLAFSLLVIVSHSYPLLLGNGNLSEPVYRITGGQRTAGELAVDGFFLISGYLITASWWRSRSLVDYLRRRVLRIYPGFLVAVAFSSLVAGPLLVADSADYWRRFAPLRFLGQALGLQGAYTPAVEGLAVNGSLWSIRYEFHCYLALAAFGLAGVLRRRVLVVLFGLFCTFIQARVELSGWKLPGSGLSWVWGYPQDWPRVAACFFAGSAFHLYADRIKLSRPLALICLTGLLLAACLPGSKALPLLIPYLGGYLVFSLAYTPLSILKNITKRGDFSYGLYLYAFPVQLLLIKWLRPGLTPTRLSILAILVTSGFAALSWFFVERPCLRLKRTSEPVSGAVPAASVVGATADRVL